MVFIKNKMILIQENKKLSDICKKTYKIFGIFIIFCVGLPKFLDKRCNKTT